MRFNSRIRCIYDNWDSQSRHHPDFGFRDCGCTCLYSFRCKVATRTYGKSSTRGWVFAYRLLWRRVRKNVYRIHRYRKSLYEDALTHGNVVSANMRSFVQRVLDVEFRWTRGGKYLNYSSRWYNISYCDGRIFFFLENFETLLDSNRCVQP